MHPYKSKPQSDVCGDDLPECVVPSISHRTIGTGNNLRFDIHRRSGVFDEVCTSPKWHARRVAMEFVQNMVFSNLFTARPYAQRLRDLVIRCLFDEQYEVRNVASITLSGFYQCGFVSMTDDDFVSRDDYLEARDQS